MPTMLGVDAEFVCADINGDINLTARNTLGVDGHLGADGAGVPFEVRPNPHCRSAKVVSSMREAMRLGLTMIPSMSRYKWSCNSLRHPCGLHIHIDRSLTSPGSAAPLETIALLASFPSSARIPDDLFQYRLSEGYGQLMSYRTDHMTSDGGSHRIEYRDFGGVWETPEETEHLLDWTRAVGQWPLDYNEEYKSYRGELRARASLILGDNWERIRTNYIRHNRTRLREWTDFLALFCLRVPSLREVSVPFFSDCSREIGLLDLKKSWNITPLPVETRPVVVETLEEYLDGLRTYSSSGRVLSRFVKEAKTVRSMLLTNPLQGKGAGIKIVPVIDSEEEGDDEEVIQ